MRFLSALPSILSLLACGGAAAQKLPGKGEERRDAPVIAVTAVQVDSPPDRAGVKAGDVILILAGESIASVEDFQRVAKALKAGMVPGAPKKTHPLVLERRDGKGAVSRLEVKIGSWIWGIWVERVPRARLESLRKRSLLFDRAKAQLQKGQERSDARDSEGAIVEWKAGLALAEQAKAGRLVIYFTCNIGSAHAKLGNNNEAYRFFRRSYDLSRKMGNWRGLGKSLAGMASLHSRVGEYKEALELHRLALKAFQRPEFRRDKITTHFNIGVALDNLGRYAEALKAYQTALSGAREMGDRALETTILLNLGELYRLLNRYNEGLGVLDRALKLSRELGDPEGESGALRGLGDIQLEMEKEEIALRYYRESLALARKFRLPRREALALQSTGAASLRLGRNEKGKEVLERAASLFRKQKDRKSEAYTQLILSHAYFNLSEYTPAMEVLHRSLKLYREGGDFLGVAKANAFMGDIQFARKEVLKALRSYEESVKIARQIGNPTEEAQALGRVGQALERLGEYEKSLKTLEAALRIAETLKDDSLMGNVLSIMGNVYMSLRLFPRAQIALERALSLFRGLGTKKQEGILLGNLGNLYFHLEDFEKALEYHERALAIFRASGNRLEEAHFLLNTCAGFSRLGKPREALRRIEESMRLMRSIGVRSPLYAYWNRASMFTQDTRYKESISYRGRFTALVAPYLQALKEEIRNMGSVTSVEMNIPLAETAIDFSWTPEGVPEAQRGKVRSSPIVGIAGDWEGIPISVRKACEASHFLGWTHLEVGFHIAESLRAREFLWDMQKRAGNFEKNLDPELLEARKVAEHKINAVRSQLIAAGSGKPILDDKGDALDPGARKLYMDSLVRSLNALKEERERADRAIALASPPLGTLENVDPPRLQTFQASLGEDELFLEYVLTGQEPRKHRIRLGKPGTSKTQLLSAIENQASGDAYLLAVTRHSAGRSSKNSSHRH
ncbi:MAG: tetratricopeptide repeat protein [Planctomycetota bacterium]|jgi:tetratricopeptide (TPR) repeat protein